MSTLTLSSTGKDQHCGKGTQEKNVQKHSVRASTAAATKCKQILVAFKSYIHSTLKLKVKGCPSIVGNTITHVLKSQGAHHNRFTGCCQLVEILHLTVSSPTRVPFIFTFHSTYVFHTIVIQAVNKRFQFFIHIVLLFQHVGWTLRHN